MSVDFNSRRKFLRNTASSAAAFALSALASIKLQEDFSEHEKEKDLYFYFRETR